jgi:hypothetical protein
LSARSFGGIVCASLAVAAALRFATPDTEQSINIARVALRPRPPEAARTPRKVYPYSVIPGGAYSGEELALARRVDRVVAEHYADFEPAAASLRALPADAYLYVSYRKGDKVYWTANKRRIPKGEMVLCDGQHLARGRCGNRLSAVPQFPIAAGPQPAEAALNAPELPSGLALPEAPLFAPRYDAPAMPLLEARDRLFEFPAGMTGASPLGSAFGPLGLQSPIMAVADLPFHTLGVSGGPGGSTPAGSSSGVPGGPGGGGSSPGGSAPGGGGGVPGGGTIPGAPVPEPASITLIAAAGALAMFRLARRAQRLLKAAIFSSK